VFVYNLTTKINWAVAEEWLIWEKEEHIPEIMATKLFDDYKIYRLSEQDDPEGPTFIIQYFTSTEDRYKKYIDKYALAQNQKAFDKWGDQFIAHKTFMQQIS